MKKRVLSFFLAVALVFSLVVIPTSAKGNVEVRLNTVGYSTADAMTEYVTETEELEKASIGDFVAAKIIVANNTDNEIWFSGYHITLNYDATAFETVTYPWELSVNGSVIMSGTAGPFAKASKGAGGISWQPEVNTKNAGVADMAATSREYVNIPAGGTATIGYLLLKVKAEIETGEYAITFAEGEQKNYVNSASGKDESVDAKIRDAIFVPASLTINGVAPTLKEVTLSSTPVQVDGANGATVNATATSTSNKDITGLVTWSISGDENSGVSINAETGKITVDAKAKAGGYIVTATAIAGKTQGAAQNATLTVTRALSGYKITVTPLSKAMIIPTSEEITQQFTATAVDRYDDEVTSGFTWSLNPSNIDGVSIDSSNGLVTVTAGAKSGITTSQDFDVIATLDNSFGQPTGRAILVVKRDSDRVPSSVVISGGPANSTLPVLKTGDPTATATATYTATVYDQYGTEIENPGEIRWYLEAGDESQQFGTGNERKFIAMKEFAQTFAEDSTSREIIIKAICGGASGTTRLILTREPATVTSLSLVGDAKIAVPKNGEAEVTRSYLNAYDQYGVAMNISNLTIEWKKDANVKGVNFVNGGIKVSSAAAENKFTEENGKLQFTFDISASIRGNNPVTKTITLTCDPAEAKKMIWGTDDRPVEVPAKDSGKADANVTVTVYDQYGQKMTDAKVELDGAQEGFVWENGLKVTKAAVKYFEGERKESVTVNVNLKSGNATATAKVTLKLEAAQTGPQSAEISGQTSIARPTGDTPNTAVYTILKNEIKDQYGLPMKNVDRSKLSLKLYSDQACVTEVTGALVTLSGPDQSGQWTITVTSGAEVNTKYYLMAYYNDQQCSGATPITITNKATSETPLNVVQGDITYGETVSPSVSNKPETAGTITYTYVGRDGTTYAKSTTKPTNAGTYTVTATCEDANYIYTGSKDFEIKPKALTDAMLTIQSSGFVYNGQNQSPVYEVKDGETDLNTNAHYDVTSGSTGKDAGAYTLRITGKGNYTGSAEQSWSIRELPVKIGTATFQPRAYDKENYSAVLDTLMLVADEDGVTMPDTLTAGDDFTVSDIRVAKNNVGQQPVSFKVTLTNPNYKWVVEETGSVFNVPERVGFKVEITPADHAPVTVPPVSGKYGNQLSVDLSQVLPENWSAAVAITENTNGVLTTIHGDAMYIMEQDGKLWLQLTKNPTKVGKSATVTLTVESTNYNPFTITITVTVQGKETQTVTASDLNVTYGDAGVKLNASALDNAKLAYEVTEGKNVVTVDTNGNVTLLKSGTAKIQITAAETEDYGTANTTVTVTVAKRSLTVKANDLTAYVGGQLPALDYTVTGLVSGETLTTVPELELKDVPAGVDPMKTAGTYTIGFKTAPVADKDKYDLTVETGTLTVSSRPNVNPVPAGNSVKLEEAAGGKLTSSVSRATKGTTVTITVKPDAGYQLEELEVLDKNGEALPLKELANGKFSFQMPDSKVTVQASFVQESTYAGYPDVLPQDWFYSSVRYVTERGLMNGTPNGFEPNMDSSRATIWTILARFSGVDTTVVSGEWYAVARQWAMENGVSDGTNPNGVITREQLATMLYRFAKNKGLVQEPVTADLSVFVDAGQISDYALDAMRWAVSVGLLNGMDGSRLAPQGSAARAQVAAMLMRFDQLAK